jgi:hypothetical protein
MFGRVKLLLMSAMTFVVLALLGSVATAAPIRGIAVSFELEWQFHVSVWRGYSVSSGLSCDQ